MNEIVVALDNMDRRKALAMASILTGKVWGFKVNDLLLECGTEIINSLKQYGKVFADPKLHDTPTTVRNSVDRLVFAGADLITCHIMGGVSMLKAAVETVGDKAKIIGVTMLTSLGFDEIRQLYRGFPLERLSDIVTESKIHGVVCSNQEVPFWTLFNLIKVVPGIRPFGPVKDDDQVRICQVAKVEFLVVGRPVTLAENPVEAVENIKRMYEI